MTDRDSGGELSDEKARGILAGHFETADDVNRFIREERDLDEHAAFDNRIGLT
jgi:hypothetical protein